MQIVKLWCTVIILETAVAGDGCQNYIVLSDPTRAVSYIHDGARTQCDNNLPTNWYRFMGQAGDRMLDYCYPYNGVQYPCQTHAGGWLNGQHPRVHDGEVTRTVCYSWSGGCCVWSNYVTVKSCGNFYVYRLTGNPNCALRYCGNGVGK